ncbi:hypothetical protein D9M68_845700 [compost metagenome]
MPQIGAISSGLYAATLRCSSSKPMVRLSMKSRSTRPSLTITCIIALSSATSASGLNCRKRQAKRARSERRGSATISLVPFFTAFLIQLAATGWFTVGLAPITITTSALSTSITGLDTAPEPMPSSSAATDDAWHSRVQWSTLLLPKPVRTSFWNR